MIFTYMNEKKIACQEPPVNTLKNVSIRRMLIMIKNRRFREMQKAFLEPEIQQDFLVFDMPQHFWRTETQLCFWRTKSRILLRLRNAKHVRKLWLSEHDQQCFRIADISKRPVA